MSDEFEPYYEFYDFRRTMIMLGELRLTKTCSDWCGRNLYKFGNNPEEYLLCSDALAIAREGVKMNSEWNLSTWAGFMGPVDAVWLFTRMY